MSLLNDSVEEPESTPSKSGNKLPLLTLGILMAVGLGALVVIGSLILNRLNELESQMLGGSERGDGRGRKRMPPCPRTRPYLRTWLHYTLVTRPQFDLHLQAGKIRSVKKSS